jgi:broad specificity phosphatase PhoE
MTLPALAFIAALKSQSSLTFVRHGETVANATGRYNERTLNSFSEKGKQEVLDLTRTLLTSPRFDRILVSPSPRVLETIAPYLRATHQRAVIWPLLYECCTGRRPHNAHATKFSYGERIAIPPDLTGLFTVEPGHDRYPIAPKYDQGLAQVDAALTEYRRSFGSGRVLLVGHSGQGGHFIHALTGKWIKLENAKETVVPVH